MCVLDEPAVGVAWCGAVMYDVAIAACAFTFVIPYPGSPVARRAQASIAAGQADPSSSQCLFRQMFDGLKAVPVSQMRCLPANSLQMFEVAFQGEPGIDAGGLFRYVLCCSVLCSKCVCLCLCAVCCMLCAV